MRKRYKLLSKTEFEKQLNIQEYKCPICGNILLSDKNTHVDHNHTTGKIREILCSRCNHCIGNTKENIQTIKNLILYLEIYGE